MDPRIKSNCVVKLLRLSSTFIRPMETQDKSHDPGNWHSEARSKINNVPNSVIKEEKPFFFQDVLEEMKTEQPSKGDSAVNESHAKIVYNGEYLYIFI